MPIVLDGTTNTVTPLTASGVATFTAGSAAAPALTTAGDTNTGIFFPAADTIAFSEGGTESMRIDSAGNLLVGTASVLSAVSNYKTLQVTGTTGGIVDIGSNSTIYGRCSADSAGMNVEATVAGTPVFFRTGGTERMRIDSAGNLGVGGTPTYRFDVTASAANSYIGFHQNTANTADDNMYLFRMGANANTANATFLYCQTSTTQRFTVRGNGGIANFSANNVNLSDERVKKGIIEAGNYLDKICAIPVRTFLYKDQTDDELNLGVIAQEVEAIAPELVSNDGFGETPEDGIPLKTIYQTDLQYALMKSIQELNAKFEEYKASHP